MISHSLVIHVPGTAGRCYAYGLTDSYAYYSNLIRPGGLLGQTELMTIAWIPAI